MRHILNQGKTYVLLVFCFDDLLKFNLKIAEKEKMANENIRVIRLEVVV